jgi:Zn-dependent peptidase ImmA (M78 family)
MGGRFTIGDTAETIIDEASADQIVEMERQANRFAAELLMPAAVCRARARTFRATYGVCPRSTFAYHLASELLVSSRAMRYRLNDLGVGDE